MTIEKFKKISRKELRSKQMKEQDLDRFGLGTIINHIKKNWVDIKTMSKTFKISDQFGGNQLP